MFNCCAAYLPQQFVLVCVLLSFGKFMRHYHDNIEIPSRDRYYSILFFGIGCIVGKFFFTIVNGLNSCVECLNDIVSPNKNKQTKQTKQNKTNIGCWPFVGLLGIPLAFFLCYRFGTMWFIKHTILIGICLIVLIMLVDYAFVEKWFVAPLNIALYNLHIGEDTSGGQNLYGVETWVYYVKNLFSNFNVVYILAMVSPLFSGLIPLVLSLVWQKLHDLWYIFRSPQRANKIRMNNKDFDYMNYLLNIIGPLFIWYLFFTYMKHKVCVFFETFEYILYVHCTTIY